MGFGDRVKGVREKEDFLFFRFKGIWFIKVECERGRVRWMDFIRRRIRCLV